MIMEAQKAPSLKQRWILQDRFVYPVMLVFLLLLISGLFLKSSSAPVARAIFDFACMILSFGIATLWIAKIITEIPTGIKMSPLKRFFIPACYTALGCVELADFVLAVIKL